MIANVARLAALITLFSAVSATAQSAFVENLGQYADERVLFRAKSGDVSVSVTRTGLALHRLDAERALAATALLEWGGSATSVHGGGERAGVEHHLRGPEHAWVRGVPTFAYVTVDVADVTIEVSLIDESVTLAVAEGRVDALSFSLRGASGSVDERDGRLVVVMPSGSVEVSASIDSGARRARVTEEGHGAYTIIAEPDDAVASDGDPNQSGLLWSTCIPQLDLVEDLDVTLSGDLVVFGWTASVDYPVTAGAFDVDYGGEVDTVVTRLTPDGSSIQFATYFGGDNGDFGGGYVDADGSLVVAGWTASSDFPTTAGAFDPTKNIHAEAFVARLSSEGDALLASTLYGGSSSTLFDAVERRDDGAIVMAGTTSADDLPLTPGAVDTRLGTGGGSTDVFIAVFDPTLSHLLAATYLGGMGNEALRGLVVTDDGDIVVTGSSFEPVFVTPGAFELRNRNDYVTRLSPALDEVVFSMNYGSIGSSSIWGLATRPDDSIVVVGETSDALVPTTPDAFAPAFTGTGLLGVLSPDGSELLYSTFIPGDVDIRNAHVDSSGVVTLVGQARFGFPATPGAHKQAPTGFSYEAFVMRFDPTLDHLLYATLLGGSEDEAYSGADLLVDDEGRVILSAATESTDFPATTTIGPACGSSGGAFVTKFSMLPEGVERVGQATPGARGKAWIGVGHSPSVGAVDFTITCSNAPAATPGVLLVSSDVLADPVTASWVDLWVDPLTATALPVVSDSQGWHEFRAVVPDDPSLVGMDFGAQFVWDEQPNPSSSNALRVTVVP